MADGTKRKVSAKGARRGVRFVRAEGNEYPTTMPDVFDLMECEDVEAIVDGVERGSVRAVKWEVL